MGATIVTGLATAQINKVDPLSKNVKSVYIYTKQRARTKTKTYFI